MGPGKAWALDRRTQGAHLCRGPAHSPGPPWPRPAAQAPPTEPHPPPWPRPFPILSAPPPPQQGYSPPLFISTPCRTLLSRCSLKPPLAVGLSYLTAFGQHRSPRLLHSCCHVCPLSCPGPSLRHSWVTFIPRAFHLSLKGPAGTSPGRPSWRLVLDPWSSGHYTH